MDLQAGRPNALLKSKSLNARVKPRVAEKKSKSSGEFKTLIVKKRGVYVEKRGSSIGPYPPQVVPPPTKIKAPPRSRPGTKPFLASVLSILSKTTTGTQYPVRTPRMSKIFQSAARSKEHKNDDNDLMQNTVVKKPKYKSKDEDSLKSKRDLQSRTSLSSHYSKDTKFTRKLTDDVPEEVSAENKTEPGESKVARSVLEGNRMHLEKELLDPMTLVGTAAKDEKLYSLFVNLLETVYNAKPEPEDALPRKKSIKSLKVIAQEEESPTVKRSITEVSPADHIVLNSRVTKVISQPFDLKWREHELQENIKESTHEIEVDCKPSQTNVCGVIHEAVKKPKYRSKALNDEVNKKPPERIVVLKSKNELQPTLTSSSSKDTDKSNVSIKWADFLPKLVDSETGEAIRIENTIDLENSIAKSVMEGNRLNMEKKTADTTTTSAPEKEKKLYSLFVNLLESVYTDNPPSEFFVEGSTQSSRMQFEMDVNVAQKLNDVMQKTYEYSLPPCDQCNYKPRQEWRHEDRLKYHRDPYDVRWSNHDDVSEAPVKRVKKKVKRHASNRPESAEQRAPTNPRLPFRNRNKKQELLAIIKRQLSKDDDSYKEPETFYDALRIMARNSRKDYNYPNAKTIRCTTEVGDESDYDTACRFKKRKAAPRYTRNTKPTRNTKANRATPASARFKYSHSEYKPVSYEAESTGPPDSDDSYHSLVVYGYDYEWKPHAARSSSSSAEIVNDEVNYSWQSAVGSQCCN